MRILIVEDDLGLGKILKSNLEENSYVVDLESNGEKGLQMALVNDYDLIILDNILPGKNGLEVCTELRAKRKNVPVLVSSVHGEIKWKVDLLDKGADDYITKPFSYEELRARIGALLRRPSHIEAKKLIIDNLILDEKKFCAFRNGKRIYLTSKEFELLQYLLRNSGMVLTRGMIMEHVWDKNADPFSNTIETHIANLRRKIDRMRQSRKLIHTVPGRGYKIDTER